MLTIERSGHGKAIAGVFGQLGTARKSLSPRLVRNFAGAQSQDSLRLYQPLGELGSELDDFAKQLEAIGPNADVDVMISCDGGCPFTGLALYSLLSRHQGNITAYVDGLARGPGATVCMAADTINASPSSHMVLELPVAMTWGNSNVQTEAARVLQKVGGTIAEIFARRSGSRWASTFEKMMDESKWLTADEAKAAGLVDRVTEPKRGTSKAEINNRLRKIHNDGMRLDVAARLREIARHN